jgi:hypothetical protein
MGEWKPLPHSPICGFIGLNNDTYQWIVSEVDIIGLIKESFHSISGRYLSWSSDDGKGIFPFHSVEDIGGGHLMLVKESYYSIQWIV